MDTKIEFQADTADTNTTGSAVSSAAEVPQRAKPPGKKRAAKNQLPTKTAGRSGSATKPPRALTRSDAPVVLSLAAVAYLEKREHLIDLGRKGSMAMAVALYEIKHYDEGDLLQGRYKSVADYAEQRFCLEKGYTSMLLKTGGFMVECQAKFTNVNKLPKSEGQIRALLRLPKAERITLWEDTVKDCDSDQVTGKSVTERVLQRAEALGLKWAKPAAPKAAPPVTPPAPPQPAPPAPPEIVLGSEAYNSLETTTAVVQEQKSETQALDDEIRAVCEHLHSLVAGHRKAVVGSSIIRKFPNTLEIRHNLN